MLNFFLKLFESQPKETTVWINSVSEMQVKKFEKGEEVFFKEYIRNYKNGKKKKEVHLYLKNEPGGLKIAKLRDTENWAASTLNKYKVIDIFWNTDGWQIIIK